MSNLNKKLLFVFGMLVFTQLVIPKSHAEFQVGPVNCKLEKGKESKHLQFLGVVRVESIRKKPMKPLSESSYASGVNVDAARKRQEQIRIVSLKPLQTFYGSLSPDMAVEVWDLDAEVQKGDIYKALISDHPDGYPDGLYVWSPENVCGRNRIESYIKELEVLDPSSLPDEYRKICENGKLEFVANKADCVEYPYPEGNQGAK